MTPKVKTFCERGFSTVVLLGMLGGALLWDKPIGYAILIGLFCNLTSWEWYNMLREKTDEVCRPVILGLGVLYPWVLYAASTAQHAIPVPLFALAYAILYILVLFFCGLFRMDYCGKTGVQSLSGMGLGLLSFFYPVWLFAFAMGFVGTPHLVHLLLLLILATKMSDIWAYVSGVLMGGKFFSRKFSPTISPKKTWEGIIGSFIITFLATYGLLCCMSDISAIVTFGKFCIAMPVVFVLAVAGDLAGSLIKRGIGVKDSGSLLPGIGGIFDLIDSPSFTVSALVAVSILFA